MPTCRLGNSFSEMYVGVEPNRDCVYGSCRRPMHRKLLQEAAMAVTFVMMSMVFDRFLSLKLDLTNVSRRIRREEGKDGKLQRDRIRSRGDKDSSAREEDQRKENMFDLQLRQRQRQRQRRKAEKGKEV